ncbi:nicotinate-nucleotide adenylyltransferase, putative [Plasmodium vinckei vinckei]|uniref:Nicotinate-nucleotide adenylyltransferase, putative n=1 Tax=Plasmodium vinckei vinckei TaxID=54757 RepID=A0A449BYG0_PLAVN|nr:nicotinate-nucleotide adenylyltransferase, putative [Plasmodium vinckei vinckei]KEG04865.1 nicotinate (nicotinamide) nucleotide adenylyltransferase [Plasmodium vinckei vinckei]VEV58517.1 nicotinate-nucleotide adenylyltransferase, putative [Plasmodium vinckei vinckei]
MNKKICIYGGSFDPVTYGHEMVLSKISNLEWVDEVWVVICRCRYDKNLEAFDHRNNMFFIMFENNTYPMDKSKIFVKDLESENTTATYDLLNMLKKTYPQHEFYFIIGSDLLNDLTSWDNGEKLVSENNFIVVERGDFDINKEILKKMSKYYLIEIPVKSFVNYISSTDVRKILAKQNNDDLKQYINLLAIDYIYDNNLYKSDGI